ncbi:hypothetical protein A2W32_04900 [candidate division WWE3 bacterium RBG_16_37_10]|uniref:Uncharacterized protein n=1 Tax=candidate division WWE3 bacterium RBG_16_37_10 TaxID=1802610 RepID=A0A1F4UXH2_UNCKA|nr:MAG: hypothetical protein A2W32_04900 [candidate division WWE3 bacterium RBG_16_37_10]
MSILTSSTKGVEEGVGVWLGVSDGVNDGVGVGVDVVTAVPIGVVVNIGSVESPHATNNTDAVTTSNSKFFMRVSFHLLWYFL